MEGVSCVAPLMRFTRELKEISVSRRGRDAGPQLTPRTCVLGAQVRVTASNGGMAGASGYVLRAGDGTNPTIRFKSGHQMRIPTHRLQLLDGLAPVDVEGQQALDAARAEATEERIRDEVQRRKLRRKNAPWGYL